MSRRIAMMLGCALTLGPSAYQPSFAQSQSVSPDDDWRSEVTVLAIAPDGTWGAATEPSVGRAIANAIDHCKRKYRRAVGCGHRFTAIRGGWSLGFRCGSETIIVAEKNLVDAEWMALRRERELRTQYLPDLPACVRTVMVDPHGAAVAQDLPQDERAVARQPSTSAKRIR